MSRSRSMLVAFVAVADLLVVGLTLSIAIATVLRGTEMGAWPGVLGTRITVLNAIVVGGYMVFWHLCLRGAGLYESYRLAARTRELRDLAVASLVAVAPVVPAGIFLGYSFVTQSFVVSYLFMVLPGLSIERAVLRAVARNVRRHGRNLNNAIIIGEPEAARDLRVRLSEAGELGYRITEVILVGGGQRNDRCGCDALAKLERVLADEPVDEVLVAAPLGGGSCVSEVVACCEKLGVAVRVFASLSGMAWGRAVLDQLLDQPVITITSGYPGAVRYPVKRAIDLIVATSLLVVLAPLLTAVAVAIKLGSPGPALFAQERVGQNRRRFKLYKFRTMVRDAERMQTALERHNEARGPVFKINDDPRVTRLGKFLRRYSIDELPQLFNVLRGEMSLVGPRPLPVRDVEKIVIAWHKRRFSVRPGITCIWQVRSREPVFDEWIKADMEYIDNWSLGLDLKILTATIPAVFLGNGIH